MKTVKKIYPGCEGTDWYCCVDIQYLVQDYHGKQMRNQDNLGEYTRVFHKRAAILITNKKLAKMEHNLLYLNRFPTAKYLRMVTNH